MYIFSNICWFTFTHTPAHVTRETLDSCASSATIAHMTRSMVHHPPTPRARARATRLLPKANKSVSSLFVVFRKEKYTMPEIPLLRLLPIMTKSGTEIGPKSLILWTKKARQACQISQDRGLAVTLPLDSCSPNRPCRGRLGSSRRLSHESSGFNTWRTLIPKAL
jgi:hypothetical protein